MKYVIEDLLSGFLRHNLVPGYPAEVTFLQIRMYVERGHFSFEDFNSKIREIEKKVSNVEIIEKKYSNNLKMIKLLKETLNDTGFMKIHSDASPGMNDGEVLVEFYNDVFYLF